MRDGERYALAALAFGLIGAAGFARAQPPADGSTEPSSEDAVESRAAIGDADADADADEPPVAPPVDTADAPAAEGGRRAPEQAGPRRVVRVDGSLTLEETEEAPAPAPSEEESDRADCDGCARCHKRLPCRDREHTTMIRFAPLGIGDRHEDSGHLLYGLTLDLSLRPLYGLLLIGLSGSTQQSERAQFYAGGITIELDVSHLIESNLFSCQPDRHRWWGLSVGLRLGITYAISSLPLYPDLEPVGLTLLRPEWTAFLEWRFRPWDPITGDDPDGLRLLLRIEHYAGFEFTPSRTMFLLGASWEIG
ncbi:MAG: hypothetical protein AB7S26_08530 [Sandaracinaceae bacterium]